MASENKKANELVSDDDDPTAELEVLNLRNMESADADIERESDASTYGFSSGDDTATTHHQSIPKLQSDLEARTKTIGRLQFDIEQLRSKWLGLEKEIGAREEIVTNLLEKVDDLDGRIERKDKLLRKRKKEIRSLRTEIGQRDETYGLLEQQHAELETQHVEQRSSEAAIAETLKEVESGSADLRATLETAQNDIASLKTDVTERDEAYALLEQQHAELETQIGEQRLSESEVTGSLRETERELVDLRATLEAAQNEITSFKADIGQRDNANELLEKQLAELEMRLEEQRSSEAELAESLKQTEHESVEIRDTLEAAQDQITSLETEMGQRDEANGLLEKQLAELETRLGEQRSSGAEVAGSLEESERASAKLRAALDTAQNEITSLNADVGQRDEAYGLLQQRHTELQNQHVELERQHAELIKQRAALEKQQAGLYQQVAQHETTNAENTAALQAAEREVQRTHERLDTVRDQSEAEVELAQKTSAAVVKEVKAQLAGAEKYADTLRYKLQEFTESQSAVLKERDKLNETVEQMTARYQDLSEELDTAVASIGEFQEALKQQRTDHEQEMQLLRSELEEAHHAVTEAGVLNTQLAAELLDSHGYKEELEDQLSQNEELARRRVDELEEQVRKLSAAGEELEQELNAKSSSVNALLGELAKKKEEMESIGEIEGVIQEIDDRMSGHIDETAGKTTPEPGATAAQSGRERITRVLIGSVGDKELRFPLFKNRLTIGRTHENDIQLKTSYVSRRHAVVVTEGDSTRIIDWGSKNGVFVNSKRIKEQVLSNGDIVSVGNAEFRYEERQKRDT